MEAWIGEIVGAMHINRISSQRLADELGWSRPYLSAILNGRRTPQHAEEKIRTALNCILGKNKAGPAR